VQLPPAACQGSDLVRQGWHVLSSTSHQHPAVGSEHLAGLIGDGDNEDRLALIRAFLNRDADGRLAAVEAGRPVDAIQRYFAVGDTGRLASNIVNPNDDPPPATVGEGSQRAGQRGRFDSGCLKLQIRAFSFGNDLGQFLF